MNQQSASATIAILGGGNLGQALALGWVDSGAFEPEGISITRRHPAKLSQFEAAGYFVSDNNGEAARRSDILILAVQPQQMSGLFDDIRDHIDSKRHRIVSVVSGISIDEIKKQSSSEVPVVRAMPNTAVTIGASMTCLSADADSTEALSEACELFDLVGRTLVIEEEMMIPATALCACGVAFFLRSIRAASQGGIEIGFHPEEALLLAAQTARGAAGLLLKGTGHPESEIDRVTTPRGCTIAGLNEIEHQGFSSAMIKGILISAEKARGLYSDS